jgi:uncharacterized membrane protein YfcA
MRKLVLFGMVGVLAQLIDGALGMAYGLTSTTLLVAVGTAPAAASATVHLAELGTTAVSGVSHWRFGNVDWRTVRMMTFPGFVGAFLGAVVLSSISGDTAKPWVAVILSVLGVYVLFRFLGKPRGPRPRAGRPLPLALLAPLGLGAGFLDAVGGGGWGPVGTPTLLASGRMEPRKVIGSVDTGEFLVALGASLGFLVSLSWSQVPLSLVLLLLAGGLFAAPLAAWLVKHLAPPQARGDRRGGHPAHQRPHPGLDLRPQWGLADRHVPGHRGRGRHPGRLAPQPVPPAPPGQGHRRHRPARSRAGRRLTDG